MPAAHCCWRATARDILRVLSLLGTDGAHNGRKVLPAGWVREMTRASRVNAGTGMQLGRIEVDGVEAFEVKDGEGSAFWLIPHLELAILDISNPGGSAVDDLPRMLIKGVTAATPP
jgi:CubicO group peptidase (beta-lactamase class C family)